MFYCMAIMANSKTQRALDLVRAKGMVRPRDLIAKKIPPDYFDRLHRRGLIERISRVTPGLAPTWVYIRRLPRLHARFLAA